MVGLSFTTTETAVVGANTGEKISVGESLTKTTVVGEKYISEKFVGANKGENVSLTTVEFVGLNVGENVFSTNPVKLFRLVMLGAKTGEKILVEITSMLKILVLPASHPKIVSRYVIAFWALESTCGMLIHVVGSNEISEPGVLVWPEQAAANNTMAANTLNLENMFNFTTKTLTCT